MGPTVARRAIDEQRALVDDLKKLLTSDGEKLREAQAQYAWSKERFANAQRKLIDLLEQREREA